MHVINERELIVQLRDGDEKAFAELYNQYSEVLYSFLVKLGIQHDDIKDLVQHSFIKLWEYRAGLNEELSLRSYLITIAKNNIYNSIKKRLTEKKHQNNTVSQTEDKTWQRTELQDLLRNILLQLPDKRREVFTMSRIEGYSNKEIAEMLNISKSTVENHINHSTKQVKGILKRLGWSE